MWIYMCVDIYIYVDIDIDIYGYISISICINKTTVTQQTPLFLTLFSLDQPVTKVTIT